MSTRVGLGILGVGRWADAHARAAARSERVHLVNCHSRSPEARTAFRMRHGLPRDSSSIEELLGDPGVEAVVVSTPNDLHADHAARVLETGRPVLVDKPLAVDVVEGLSLLRLAARSEALLGVAHHPRRLAGHRAARQWIREGGAGTVRVAHADFSNPRGADMPPEAWHRSARGSQAGVLIQVGIHQVENLLSLLGPALSVNARFAYGALGPDMPDAVALVMAHTGGALSTVTSSWTTPGHYRLDLLATGGNLAFRLDHGHWTSPDVDGHGELLLQLPGGRPEPRRLQRGDPLREQLEELGRAARNGIPMEVGAVEGLRAVAVVEAAVRSARAGGAEVRIEELAREAGASSREVDLVLGREGSTPAS